MGAKTPETEENGHFSTFFYYLHLGIFRKKILDEKNTMLAYQKIDNFKLSSNLFTDLIYLY